jgi:hypothetical protein
MKALEKRAEIVEAIKAGILTIKDIGEVSKSLDDKKIAIILEAMEEITRSQPDVATLDWLLFSEQYIDAQSNSLKRESSRVVGNVAHIFQDSLTVSIQKLLKNTNNEGTVVRWGSAYALGKIIALPRYACSDLFDTLAQLCEQESENGVKNQYVKALKKAEKQRKQS